MKRMLSMILCAVFLLPLFGSLFVAETASPLTMTVTLNDAQDHITVAVSAPGLRWNAIDFALRFDPTALSLTSVSDGHQIQYVRNKDYPIMTQARSVALSNEDGFCNFVAVIGSTSCKTEYWKGTVATFTFKVIDLTKATASLDLCVGLFLDAKGEPLFTNQSYNDGSDPVPLATHSEKLYKCGDLNRDGVTIFDAMLIMQELVDLVELTEYQRAAADVSGEGELTIFDAMLIMQKLVGLIETFPAEAAA